MLLFSWGQRCALAGLYAALQLIWWLEQEGPALSNLRLALRGGAGRRWPAVRPRRARNTLCPSV